MELHMNGYRFTSWESLEVQASMKDGTRTFKASITESQISGDPDVYWAPPGTPVQVYASGGELLLDGYVNKYDPSFTDTSHTIAISGRSGSQDAIDSSAEHPTGTFLNKTAVEIANELGQNVNVTYFSEDTLPKISVFSINQGERVHQVARRLADTYGYTLMCDGTNRIEFAKAKDELLGQISEGIFPLKAASASLDDMNLYSNFKIKSQLSSHEDKYGEEAAHNASEVQDSRSTRYRPYIRVMDKAADRETARSRADWHARRVSGDSAKVSATIYGHHINGALVTPNRRLYVNSEFLKISHEMLVDTVTWKKDNSGGTTTDMTLVPPASFGGKEKSNSGKPAKTTPKSTNTTSANRNTKKSTPSAPSNAYNGSTPSIVPTPLSGSVGNVVDAPFEARS